MIRSLVFIAVLGLVMACQERQSTDTTALEQETTDSIMVVNGVERTELALLMRRMYEEMEAVKDSLESGYSVKARYLEAYKRIHTAYPTEPEKIDETYHAMADAFLVNYELFEAGQGDQTNAFDTMVQQCLACHANKCPGPVKAIKKLRIKPNPAAQI